MARKKPYIPRNLTLPEVEKAIRAVYQAYFKTIESSELDGLTDGTIPIADENGVLEDSIVTGDANGIDVDGNITTDTIIFDTAYSPTGSEALGTWYWDADALTYSAILENGVTGQLFEESFIVGQNDTGSTLANGTVATYAGSIGSSGHVRVSNTVASASEHPMYTIGIVTADIANGERGQITTEGKVRGIQTDGANYSETWANGDILYRSSTIAGGLTKVAPNAPIPAIPMAVVIAAHATNGTLLVRPTRPEKLSELSDVNGTPLDADGLIPVWDNTEGYFDFTININDKQVVNNGFATDVTVTWDDGTRTVTITTTDYRFNVDGTQYRKTSSESKQIADTDGEHFVYYDNTGTLVESMTAWDLGVTAPVAIVYWNSTLSKGIAFREMHTATMDQLTHRLNHLTRGAQYISGGAIADYTLATSTDAGITFSLTETVMYDEDLSSTLSALADAGPYFKLYRTGASGLWTWDETGVLPVLTAGGGNIAWNENTGATWQLTEITANNTRVNYYVVGVPRVGSSTNSGLSFAVLPGQAIFSALADAQEETLGDVDGIGNITPEIVPMYRITMKYTASGGGTTKSEIEAVQDVRGESFRAVSTGVVGDHQTLSNRDATAAHPASSINTDTTDFDGLLSSLDIDVQTALETIDDTAQPILAEGAFVDGDKTNLDNQSGTNTGDEVDATTTVKGIVELATNGESAANVVVQGNDSRLSNARTPTAHASTHTDGTDDIQSATNTQKGLATAAHITAIEANTAKVSNATHTGEVTGATALTIADNIVDEANLKLDTAPTNDYVLTADSSASGGMKWAEASTLTAHASTHTDGTDDIATMVGDSGSGGTKGLVPAPGAGDAADDKYLKADGTWEAPVSNSDDFIREFSSSAIDLTSTASTTTYTVPTGKVLYVDKCELIIEGVSAYVSMPEVSFGISTDPDLLVPSSLVDVLAVQYKRMVFDVASNGISAGTAVTFTVDVAGSATTLTAYVGIVGYLRDA